MKLKPLDLRNQVYNLSDMNWEDETLETGIGDVDGSDPTMKGYNREYEVDPYKQRYYANKTAAKEIIYISNTAENYANEILSLWREADGPLQNFFESFTMNKLDNDLIKDIAGILREQGYKVYPILTDKRVRFAQNTDIKPFVDLQLSDESLSAIEKMTNEQNDPIYIKPERNEEYMDRDEVGFPYNSYEVSLSSRLKKKRY